MRKVLQALLAHPLASGLDLDDPRLTDVRRRVVREKPFLRAIYEDWYAWIARTLPAGDEPVLELGSGPGFLREYVPRVVRSEVFSCGGVDVLLDACALPVGGGALRAIVMTDVLHHVKDVVAFFREAERALKPGGAILMIEPWNTPLSRAVFRRLHHEPFEPDREQWELAPAGPLSGANSALPWIVFARDRARFARDFAGLETRKVEPFMPLRYLVSGGVSLRSLQPGWATGAWRAIEAALSPWRDRLAMFAKIDVRRR